MKVTYIKHSGFAVELPGKTLLFDYYEGQLPAFDRQKPLYVFSSHKHHDHFDPVVFDLAKEYEVKYILSNDIRHRPDGLDITKVGPHKAIDVDDLHIETLKSTDEGVAFLITTEGTSIYHAGDLHFWLWEEENDEDRQWNIDMSKKFPAEIDHIAGRIFDIAFLPLDPRQPEEFRPKGIEVFTERCTARHIFPMHCWEDYSVIPVFLENHPHHAQAVHTVTAQGQVFEIE
ncbi:MAG: MBL fold metallo-hydrolase [Clostridia bacterium]|nr:MBL fold metallo-hydrolase [Clostridia bacterium]